MATDLQFIKSGGTNTSVSSVSITDCFNDNYDVYALVFDRQLSYSASLYIRLINSAGTVISTANYDWASLLMLPTSANSELKATNDNQIERFLSVDARQIETHNGGAVVYVYNPTSTSSYTFLTNQSTFLNSGAGMQGMKSIAVLKTLDDITGINFFLSTGNVENLNVNVYGVKG